MTTLFERKTRMNLWWILMTILVTAAVLLLTSPAGAVMPIEVRELVIKAPVQLVDTDGDGRLDRFSADVTGFEDESAEGTVRFSENAYLAVETGAAACHEEIPTAVLAGTLYEQVGGITYTTEDVEVEAKPAGGSSKGDGGDVLVFDIVDAAAFSFEADGSLSFASDPCTQ